MNILLTSAGRRNLIIQYLKKSLKKNGGKVFAVDYSTYAPALYEADYAFLVPKISDPNYIPTLLKICKENDIAVIISLIDPELSLLAKNKVFFKEQGISCIISDENAVETCFDKYLFFQFLQQHKFKTIPTYLTPEEAIAALKMSEITFPLIIKPRTGSASIGIQKVYNTAQLNANFQPGTIIQQFIDGEEFGIDVYVDFISKKVISVFPKKKLLMRAGETDKAVSTNNQEAITLATALVTQLGLVGPIDIDCFKTKDGFITAEINPRFGGGFPLAYECGIDVAKMIMHNVKGKANEKITAFPVNRYMFKYDVICIKDQEELHE
jgi:carbamoyl-phosphate synthase large subunit